MKLTLVRHGQTDWNADRRFQGHSDIPLSDIGRAQAAQTARALSTDHFDAAYSSDLFRAIETAEIIAARHHLAIQRDARLREFDFGSWEGLTWPEITQRWPQFLEHGGTQAEYFQPIGGETFDDVRARVRGFLTDLAERGLEHVLVVTHAGTLHAILNGMAGDKIMLMQASITRITMDSAGMRLITLNDVSHLNSAS